MVEYAERTNLSIAVYSEESFWRLRGSTVLMDDMRGPGWNETADFSEILRTAPTFIRFLGADAVAAMEREFGDWPLGFRYETWGAFRECAVLNREASKRNALARLCADFQFAREAVLAIGDSRNDLPMLRWAGVGVAMGNAAPEVKEAVRYVTASNAEDGVARALEHFVLRAQEAPRMTVRVLAFAQLREILGEAKTLDLPDGATAREAWHALARAHAALGPLAARRAWRRNGAFVGDAVATRRGRRTRAACRL